MASGITIEQISDICTALPEVTERLSHGHPCFFVREKKCFVYFHDNFHNDPRVTIWCAAPPGMQQAMVESNPKQFFVPPYVGYLGWVGVDLGSGIPLEEVADVIEDAYLKVAPKKLVAQLLAEVEDN